MRLVRASHERLHKSASTLLSNLLIPSNQTESLKPNIMQQDSTQQVSHHSNTLSVNGNRAFAWYALAGVVLLIDQLTKWYFHTNFELYETVPIIEPVLNWTLAYNYGAAFSFLADQSGWQKWFFAGLAMAMSLFLLIYLRKTPRKATVLNVGLALILGGAMGNLIDRVRLGKVVDFIHVHYADVWHYPIFNFADVGICVGVALVLIDMFLFEPKRSSRV